MTDVIVELEKPPEALPPHIAQAQELTRAKGMCGAIYDNHQGIEVMCLRDPHDGPHETTREAAEPFCPDGGACHHECKGRDCFRVRCCGPLSDVYKDDEWPEALRCHFT